MKRIAYHLLVSLAIVTLLTFLFETRAIGYAREKGIVWQPPTTDSPTPAPPDTIPYPFNDHSGNPYERPVKQSGLTLPNPSNVQEDVEYDPDNDMYIIRQRMGDLDYREPYYMPTDEYIKYSFDRSLQTYWTERYSGESFSKSGSGMPKLRIPGEAFGTIFGSNSIDIKPQGSAELIFGVNISNVENPALPKNLQRQTTFDYDQKIQMGVRGSIGDKMKVGINYNTEATFDFENETKIGYQGEEDEIIQSIEAGNVSLPLTGSLITGSQSLFGFKTALKFGRLTMTSIFSQQKGETSTIEIQGGAQLNEFEVGVDEYEANRHFFLAHFFKENYDRWLEGLPIIRSGITVNRIEVWVTNKSGRFDNSRNILAMADLGEGLSSLVSGESNIYNPNVQARTNEPFPADSINSLVDLKRLFPNLRDIAQITRILENLDQQYKLKGGEDYEKIEKARLLDPSEYTVNTNLGYISLKQALNSDEVLGVAFEYTLNGKVYRVGEFSTGEIKAPNTLFIKLLKGTNLTPRLPTWDLMMKNIYSTGAYQINPEDFRLDIQYYDVETGTRLNYVPAGDIDRRLLINVLNLDNLNSQQDPFPDGQFDFIQGITIDPNGGRIIFPVREPFGSYLRDQITAKNSTDRELNELADRYVYEELYDSIQILAKQLSEKNKFFLRGSYKSSSGSEIMLNAMNIPEGSVKVTANGRELTEGTDYNVNYSLGRVTILNDALLESGTPIKISLENNALFNIGTKTLLGTHFNYQFNDNFYLGGTVLNLHERPYTNKVNIGDEPISNTIWGIDGSYTTEAPYLTRLVDRLPFVETKEKSTITVEGEFANLIPGHSKRLQESGVSFIDDFEGAKTTIELRSPQSWFLAGTPQGQSLFPEGNLPASVANGFNRARLAWYTVSTDFQRINSIGTPDHLKNDKEQLSNHFVREVYERDLFPFRESEYGTVPATMQVLNLAYYPQEKGPYNYDVDGYDSEGRKYAAGLAPDGQLLAPASRWGGIMRRMYNVDFETSNIEFIEFWLMDPFVYDSEHEGGDLYFNLGNISEDVLRDSRKMFEQGLPTTAELTKIDTTVWGIVPTLESLVHAFDNNPLSRQYQDVGLDGLSNEQELSFLSGNNPEGYDYVGKLQKWLISNYSALNAALSDPSNDDFHYYKGSDYDDIALSILERYKRFNGLEGNSPTDEQNKEAYPTSGSLLPDEEDINQDNTLSENESYFQYRVRITPQDMQVGQNYITDMILDVNKRANGKKDTVRWYQFRIPIRQPDQVVGNISDFKSIRFMRMFLTDFEQPVVMRFAEFGLVRSEWRKYNYDLTEAREVINPPQIDDSDFDVNAVNVEENSEKVPVNYVLPPEVTRIIDPTNPQLRQLNEQAISLKVIDLQDGDARGAYRNVYMDMRQYGKIEMWIHAEEMEGCSNLSDGDLVAFIRLGTDIKENFYEYQIPLVLTEPGRYDGDIESDRRRVWPLENRLELQFDVLTEAKRLRNELMRMPGSNVRLTAPYIQADGKNRVLILGNPSLSDVRTIMIGVRNPDNVLNPETDDGLPKCAEVWMNELRLADFDEHGGWAANARVSARLADFANVNFALNTSTPGFGSIEKKVQERSKEEILQYDLSSTIELGKFFPKNYGVNLPMYLGYSETFINPEYNPLDPDILLEESLDDAGSSASERERIKKQSQDYTYRKSLNFTNVRINPVKKREENPDPASAGGMPPGPGGNVQKEDKPHFYDIQNFSFTYAYNETFNRNFDTKYDFTKDYFGAINYNYNAKPKNIEPFAKAKLFQPKPLALIREFNFYLAPSQITFRTDMSRKLNALQFQNLVNPDGLDIPTSFDKDFWWNRDFSLKYNITKSLKFDFDTRNMARIDEPQGWIMEPGGWTDKVLDWDSPAGYDYERQRDTVWQNILDLGRTTSYFHKFNFTWTVPVNKLPLLGWLNANVRYGGEYHWDASPITAIEDTLGNTIRNSNTIQINPSANLSTLYNKIGFIEKINNKYKGTRRNQEMEDVSYEVPNFSLNKDKSKVITHKLRTKTNVQVKLTDPDGNEIPAKVDIIDENRVKITAEDDIEGAVVSVSGKRPVPQGIGTLVFDGTILALTGLKNVSLSYSQTNGSVLPGYLPESRLFGSEPDLAAPGFPFLAGWQDEDFALKAALKDWITTDDVLNMPYTMDKNESWNFRATYEPIKDIRVDLTATKTRRESLKEFYILNDDTRELEAKNRQFTGSFSLSFNTIRTAFWKVGSPASDYESKAYNNFLAYRETIARRLAVDRYANRQNYPGQEDYNPNAPVYIDKDGDGLVEKYSSNGYNGYTLFSSEVLIPSFLAAYSGKDPDNVPLTAFPVWPSLNWRVQFDALSKIPLIKQHFKTVTISHSYKSSYNVGAYQTPTFEDPIPDEAFIWYRDQEGNFIPLYEISTVAIREDFSPLVSLDFRFQNDLSLKAEVRKLRNLALSLANNQLLETFSNEFVFGGGYRIRDLKLNIQVGDKKQTESSDLDIRADFSIKDMLGVYRRLEDTGTGEDEQNANQPNSGQKNVSLNISADYNLSRNFNLRFFYDQVLNRPKISTSFRTSNTKVGVSLRFTLIP